MGRERGGPLLRIKSERKCLSPIRPPREGESEAETRRGRVGVQESRDPQENSLKVGLIRRRRREFRSAFC